MSKYPCGLIQLITFLKKLPGVGAKTAERFAFQLLEWQDRDVQSLAVLLSQLQQKVIKCPECHCLTDQTSCFFCHNPQRDSSQMCILASARDVYALEETGTYLGLYHVLGGLLSPMDGKMPEHLHLTRLQERLTSLPVQEVIIALDSTLEGDTTSLFLKEKLHEWGFNASRLAFGLPVGSSLDFIDGGTLTKAFLGRQSF